MPPASAEEFNEPRYDAQQDAIFVTWNSPQTREGIQYQIQYRIANRDEPENQWQYKRVQTTEGRLDLPGLRDGDEVEVEVKSELDGGNRGQPLIINIVKHTQGGGDAGGDEGELMPPLNFEATILDPSSVKLDWRPFGRHQNDGTFYVVNIKQLTTNNGGQNPLRQQIRVDGTTFTLNNLVAGEHYEITIRTASSPEHTSSTAAIVEIAMPKDEEYFEVGNLLVSSKFKADGTGTVNLTWEVPAQVRSKIEGYSVDYAIAQTHEWKTLAFNGDNPTTLLNDLRSDTEYVLKIKTRLRGGSETESGEFRFHTPKVHPNPINKVDVIYSSDSMDVRVQWTLESFVQKENIAGYDVYVSDNQNAPEQNWRLIRVDSAEGSANVDRLLTSTTYFVKIHVRQRSGDPLKSSVIYKFTTLNEYPKATQLYPRSVEIRGPKTFSYRKHRRHSNRNRLEFLAEIANSVNEARIYYTTDEEEEDLNSTVWSWVDVQLEPTAEHVLRLSELKSDSVYFIKAVPKVNGQLNLDLAENFSIKTAPATTETRKRHAHSYAQIAVCSPKSEAQQCKRNEFCIPTARGASVGWCLPRSMIENTIEHAEDFVHNVYLKVD
ncbi:hypothetical protein M3Y99_00491100 [Aphelenchoides fujianensis]|nr:hypothetical protein M3Y99_00491100 [Aphelenchoides fujianensis]